MLYRVHGLCLSCVFALPESLLVQGELPVDLHINPGKPAGVQWEQLTALPPWYISGDLDDRGQPEVQIWQSATGQTYFRYTDGPQFWLDVLDRQLWMEWSGSTLEDALTYLLGSVLGVVLHLRGIPSLHANVFAVAGRAVVLVGDSGAGKSTTSAFLACCGYPIASDDIAPLVEVDGQIWVQPGIPAIRLWQDATRFLFGDENALPQVSPNWEKRCLYLQQQYRFQAQPLPLGAIYFLSGRDESSAPRIEAIPLVDALLILIGNLYTVNLPDRRIRSRSFTLFSQIVSQIPVRRVISHASIDYLSNMCDLILRDFHSHYFPSPAYGNF